MKGILSIINNHSLKLNPIEQHKTNVFFKAIHLS